MTKRIIILGAGLAGLSCAYHLRRDYDIYEKEFEPGGLCRSNKKDGFVFDYTGHLLHFKSPYVFNLVKSLLRGNLVSQTRKSWIYSRNTLIPYPFQANIHSLKKDMAKDCLLGLFGKNNQHVRRGCFYDWMLQKFGPGIVKHFMLPYSLKFWRRHPKDLTCEWLEGRIPLPSLRDYISGAFEQSDKRWGYNWRFWYPKTGGISVLPKSFESKVKKINYNHNVTGIDLKKRLVIFNNSSQAEFSHIVSSIPLPDLGKIIYPLPQRVREALKKLNYLSVFNLNLGISENGRDKHWIYFPDKDIIFYRLGFFSSFSSSLAPEGHSSLYTEVSYLKKKPYKGTTGLTERIKKDLVTVKIIKGMSRASVVQVNDIKYGYVVYDRDYSKSRKIILEYLQKNNISSVGRFGSWSYFSMEDSILDGRQAALLLN